MDYTDMLDKIKDSKKERVRQVGINTDIYDVLTDLSNRFNCPKKRIVEELILKFKREVSNKVAQN